MSKDNTREVKDLKSIISSLETLRDELERAIIRSKQVEKNILDILLKCYPGAAAYGDSPEKLKKGILKEIELGKARK